MKKPYIVFFLVLPALLLMLHQTAQAEPVPADTQVDDVTVLLNTIRWEGMLASVLVVFVAGLLLRLVKNAVKNLGEIFADRRLMLQKFNAFFRFGVYISTIFVVILLSFDLSREVLAIIGGGTAVAIGFAAKDLVASLVAGIMIIVDRPFQLGDRVSFEGQYGDIINIGLRSVKLQTLDDNTVTIPNNMFLSSVTSCGNYGVLDMQMAISFYIGLDQDAYLASDLIREAAATSRFVHLPKPINVVVSQVLLEQCVALRLTLKIYVLDTQYEKQLETDITLRVMDTFAEHNVQPPSVLHRNVGESLEQAENSLTLS